MVKVNDMAVEFKKEFHYAHIRHDWNRGGTGCYRDGRQRGFTPVVGLIRSADFVAEYVRPNSCAYGMTMLAAHWSVCSM